MAKGTPLYGFLAEFDDSDQLLDAVRAARAAGYRELDAHTPFPVEGLAEALGFRERLLPFIALAGGIIGGGGLFLVPWWMNAVNYPINVGGRPLFAWPAFFVVAYLTGILGAVVAAFIGMLVRNGLPRLYHPVFNAPGFERVTSDRFFLAIRSADPKFDFEETYYFLRRLEPLFIQEVFP
jgi:hypothetical protein